MAPNSLLCANVPLRCAVKKLLNQSIQMDPKLL